MIALLILISVLLFLYSILMTVLTFKAANRIENYEMFTRDTIVDLNHSKEIFDQLVNRREYLADNPDIQKIQQVFAVTLDILQEYTTHGEQFTTQKEETEKEEEK